MTTRAATPLQTRPAETIPVTDEVTEPGRPITAHIVKVKPGQTATAVVMEARLNGTPLEALCGYVWVPSRDPKNLPLCDECKSIYEMYRSFHGNDKWGDRPNES